MSGEMYAIVVDGIKQDERNGRVRALKAAQPYRWAQPKAIVEVIPVWEYWRRLKATSAR